MSQELPTHGFKWMSNIEEYTAKKISELVKKNKHGYLLEVDVDYPEKLHEKHNDLPFMATEDEASQGRKIGSKSPAIRGIILCILEH